MEHFGYCLITLNAAGLLESRGAPPPRIVMYIGYNVNPTDVGAFSQSESEAETFQPAVRVDHHICCRIIRVGVLQ